MIENFDAQEIIIQNMAGHEIQRIACSFGDFHKNKQMIDVSKLIAGFYSVTVLERENVRVSSKFVKVN